MTRFIISIALIPISLIIGVILKSYLQKRKDSETLHDGIRTVLQKTTLLITNPIAFLGAVWVLPINNLEVIYLPFLGVAAISLSGVFSLIYTRIRNKDRGIRGSHFCVSFYTNIGSIGGLIVFALLGEAGFTLLPFYKLLEPIMYFGLGFPIASRFGEVKDKDKSRSLLQIFKDPFVLIPVGGIAIGLILNITGVPRPVFYADMNSILIPLGSTMLLISIGMAMHFEHMKRHIRSTFSVLTIKFILIPICITGAAYLLGLGRILDGMPLKVVFILSSMPAGFVAIMPPTLYKLDLDFANTAWLSTMIALIPVVPWLYFSLQYIIPFLIA